MTRKCDIDLDSPKFSQIYRYDITNIDTLAGGEKAYSLTYSVRWEHRQLMMTTLLRMYILVSLFGSFRVKSPKITENLNPIDSDFNEIWYMLFGNPQHQIQNFGPIGPVVWEIWPPKLWEFRQKQVRLPTFEVFFEPSYLRNELPNIHKTGIDGQALWQGFQICHSFSDWTMFRSINLLTFVMTLKLTLGITWFLDSPFLKFNHQHVT